MAPPLVLLAGSVAVCALTAWKLPASVPMGDYLLDAGQWAGTGRIADSFTPLAYPMLIGLGIRMGGLRGMLTVQALLQIGIVMLGYTLLRQLRVRRRLAVFAGFLLLFHPDLLTSITKVWDVGLPAFTLMLTVLLSVMLLRARGADWRPWLTLVALGVCFGADLSTRPNLALMLPLGLCAAVWPWRGTAAGSRVRGWFNSRTVPAAAVFLLCAALSFVELARLEHGTFFTPGNGPYNLYAGNNRFSAEWLHRNLNAEPSLVDGWRADHGPWWGTNYFDPRLNPWYLGQVKMFVREHPLQDAGLVVLKLWTLLRPDTKVHPLHSPGGFLKITLTLPAFGFLALLVWPRRPPLQPVDWWLAAASLLYVMPFMITNADPHLRTPMDAVWICAILRLLSRRCPALASAGAERS